MLSPNFSKSGHIIKTHIDRTGLAVTAWATAHNLDKNTILRICKGIYNYPSGPSLFMLSRIAKELYQDERLQRTFLQEVLSATELIPDSKFYGLAAEIAAIEISLDRIKRDLTRLANSAEQKARNAKRDGNGTDPEPAPLAEIEAEADAEDDEPEYSI
jgi:hypothetical protein